MQARCHHRPRAHGPQHSIAIVEQRIYIFRIAIAPEVFTHQQGPIAPCGLRFDIFRVARSYAPG